MEFYEIAGIIQNYAPLVGILLALGLGVFSNKKTRFILVFLIASAIVNILVVEFGILFILGRYLGELFHIVIVIALTWMVFTESNKNRPLLYFGIIVLIVQCTIRFNFQPNNTIPNISSIVDNLAVIFICFRYFFNIYQVEAEISLSNSTSFLITCIAFFYAAGGFFTSLMLEFITLNQGENAYLWIVQSSISILTYSGFAYVIWMVYAKEKQSKTELI